jgi:hypothetical protein
MTYFRELSPYTYHHSWKGKGLINIGWLDVSEPFEKGEVPERFVEKLWQRCKRPDIQMQGLHDCNLCPPENEGI